MFQRIFIVIMCLITFSFQNIESKPIPISIGCNCQPALKLHIFGLRQLAYPFDWVFSHSLYTVADCIEDNFEHWLDPDFLEYRGWHIYNTFYNIGFSHDFPMVDSDPEFTEPVTSENLFRKNFKDYLPEISEKYNRRIKRFMDLLNSNQEVIFIFSTLATRDSSIYFIQYIKNKFPNLKFTLVTVNQGSKKNKHWHQPKVKGQWIQFFGYETSSNLPWWINEEWEEIFRYLQLY